MPRVINSPAPTHYVLYAILCITLHTIEYSPPCTQYYLTILQTHQFQIQNLLLNSLARMALIFSDILLPPLHRVYIG